MNYVKEVVEEVWKVEIPQLLHLSYPIILHLLDQSKPHSETIAHVLLYYTYY